MKTFSYFSIFLVAILIYVVVSTAQMTRSPTPPTVPPPTTGAATGNVQNTGTNTPNIGTSPTNPPTINQTAPTNQVNPTSQALIDACNGKTQGTTCTYDYQSTQGSQPINGTCIATSGSTVLACR